MRTLFVLTSNLSAEAALWRAQQPVDQDGSPSRDGSGFGTTRVKAGDAGAAEAVAAFFAQHIDGQ